MFKEDFADLNRRQHTVHDLARACPRPHRCCVGSKLGGVKVAMAVNPKWHTGKIP